MSGDVGGRRVLAADGLGVLDGLLERGHPVDDFARGERLGRRLDPAACPLRRDDLLAGIAVGVALL
ncbi:hypothetical protein [Streptomyces sp. NPDC001502]|uniref:hypothetical protein n=1 Tax=Streptomyces sp. NPDC001502 TaxID=3364578 RepID=UPI0036CBABCB